MEGKRSCSPEAVLTSHGSSGAKFDVFLSFRGPDTRSNFTDFLYHALLDKGIHVFIDKKGIDIGEEIGPEIFQAIDDSKICIPIFSRSYASSSWCLRELEHMMQRRKTNELEVLPIFYDVEPSDVKLETGVYRDALTLHKEKRGAETLQRWEETLQEVARIKGWDTKNVNHGELARLIARKVLVKLKVSCVHISDHLVGMDKSVNEVVDLLNVESKDIRLIGIWGMGGIGKTTLAKVVYDKLSAKFDSCSFISNIRETSRGSDLLNVQRQLIFDILGDVGFGLSSIDHGINIIKDRFNRKKILIFLDDVDHKSQLMALAGNAQWFGPGSRIVVTTRDKSVVSGFQDEFEDCLIYEAKELNDLDAIQLFSKHAFRSNSPPNAFFNLAEKVTAKTGGLPLAIEVMGSFLCGKKEAVWEATLKKMGHCPHKDVKEKLMLSYEALDHPQQQIFLDIACFMTGYKKREPFYMWDDCGFFPDEGIEVLQLMSLVKINEYGHLWMHDQLKDLGQSIVYQENCRDSRKGSRLWRQGQGPTGVIQNKKGTETVAAFYQHLRNNSALRPQDFTKMPNIRFLEVQGRPLSGDFEDRFSELRWLYWPTCPKYFRATNFCPRNLVILNLSWSSIDEHWGGWTQLKVATRLKVLDLSNCWELKETPDLSAFLSLERLLLQSCENLLRIDCSIGHLKCLKCLNLSDCGQLQVLPIELGSLEALTELLIHNYGGPLSIREVPSSIGALINLERLVICGGVNLIRLPDSIGMLKSLVELDISKTGLVKLPNTIANLKSLKVLKISESHMQKFPEGIEMLEALTELLMGNSDFSNSISEVPISIGALINLERLVICGAVNLTKLPDSIGMLKSLVELDISKTSILELPNTINNLKSLKVLRINESYMQKLPEEIGMLEALTELLIDNSNVPGSISEVPSSVGALINLECLVVCGAINLTRLPDSIGMLKSLVELDISKTGILELPNTIANLKSLEVLKVNETYMQRLPEAIGMLEKLEEIYGEGCTQLKLIPRDIVRLPFLKILKLTQTRVENVPQLPQSLKDLCLSSSAIETAPEISNLASLDELDLCFTSSKNIEVFRRETTYSLCCVLELTSITTVSSYLGCFGGLEELQLINCGNLRHIGQLPSTLRKLIVRDCVLLEVVDFSNLSKFQNLNELEVRCCPKLGEIHGLDRLESLECLYITSCGPLLCLSDLSIWKKLEDWDVDALTTSTTKGKQVARSDDLPL